MNDQQKKQWESEESRIDDMINSASELRWDFINPSTGAPSTNEIASFFKHIAYIVTKFLESDNSPEELFINLPVEELAHNENNELQNLRWTQLCGIIINELFLSTADAAIRMINPQPEEYCNNDKFVYHTPNGKKWLLARYNLQEGYMEDDTNRYNVQATFEQSTLKLRVKRELIFKKAPDYEYLFKVRNFLTKLSDIRLGTRYCSAVLSSLKGLPPQKDTNILWNSLYFDSPVRFCSSHKQFTGNGKSADVIVVLGDKKYQYPEIWNLTPHTKKIIYIGSEPPHDNILTYDFTIREMYRYCAVNPEQQYKEPEVKYLEFPWLNDRKAELEKILADCAQTDQTLTPQIQQNCKRKLLMPFTNASFDADRLAKLKEIYKDEELIGDFLDYDTNGSTVERISEWYQGLSFDGVNPKMEYMNAAINKNKETICLPKWKSYRNTLKKCSLEFPQVIFDGLADPKYDDRYKYLLRYCLYANVESLYYTGYEESWAQSLMRFVSKEFEAYKSELRTAWGTSITFENAEIAEEPEKEIKLEDFFDYERNIYSGIYSGSSICYRVKFSDKTSAEISGDVLRVSDEEIIRVSPSDCKKGDVIIYYQNPGNLEELLGITIMGYESLNDKVKSYSDLWKNRFMEYYTKRRSSCRSNKEAIESIHNESMKKLSKTIIKKYTQENDHLFLRDKANMKAMCELLKMDNKETDYIMASKRFTEERKSFGRNLKQLVFALHFGEDTMTAEQKMDWENLSKSYTKEKLIALTCKQNTINKITEK